MPISRNDRARAFRDLHTNGILVLPNAWDPGSARFFEEAGAKAIATTSGGVAVAHGFPDGNHLPRDLAVAAIERIVRVVDVPVSADVESGFGDTAEAVCETARRVIDAGAVGINIEDGSGEPALLADKIRAIRELCAAHRSDLFVNARIDVYLYAIGEPETRFEEAHRRAALYTEAGADGLFLPALANPDALAAFCSRVTLPVNALVTPGLPSPGELETLGVRRVSSGSGLARAALHHAQRLAREMLDQGSYDGFLKGVISHADTNVLISRHTPR